VEYKFGMNKWDIIVGGSVTGMKRDVMGPQRMGFFFRPLSNMAGTSPIQIDDFPIEMGGFS
jgi:hypothetical protein